MHRRTVLCSSLALAAAGPMGMSRAWAQTPAECALHLVNALRGTQSEYLADLRPETTLMTVAQTQARHMQTMGHTSHLGARGDDPAVRARSAGYGGAISGEALAKTLVNSNDPAELVAAWAADELTRSVLLDPSGCDIGLAAVGSPGDTFGWWSLIIGHRNS